MKLFGWEIPLSRKQGLTIETVISRLTAAQEAMSGVAVTPENCMQAPTVHAIVTAISRRIATLPIRVLQKKVSKGRDRKEPLPNHPVTRLLAMPNDWQDSVAFWLDAASYLVRYGNFISWKSRGMTGPIRQLIPLCPGHVTVEQDDDWNVTYRATLRGGALQTLRPDQLLHARGASRDGVWGNSPVTDMREAIALEIMSERMGASIFGNAAMPGMVLQYQAGSQGHKTDEERTKFIENLQEVYAKKGRFKALLLPKGIEMGQSIAVENEKAQFLATRQYQRTVIAGAWGVPPHLVGDLSRGTFNNVESQSIDFVTNVVLPYVRIFEASMERSLLTDDDRRSGIIIRFNLDAALRGTFKERQEGLNIQRQAGVISANDWREHEGMNPIPADDGGEEYWRKGPSGQDAQAPGDPPAQQQDADGAPSDQTNEEDQDGDR